MSNANWLFDLENFIELFSYLPSDITTFLLAVLMVLVILAIRRVII